MAVKHIIYILSVISIGFCIVGANSESKYNFYFFDGANNVPTGKEGINTGEIVSTNEKSKETKDCAATYQCSTSNKIIKEYIEQLNVNIMKRLDDIEKSFIQKIETEIKILSKNEETKKINDNTEETRKCQCDKTRDGDYVSEEPEEISTTEKVIAKVDDGVEILIETEEINVLQPNIVSKNWLREFCTNNQETTKNVGVKQNSQALDVLHHSMQQKTGCQQMVNAPWVFVNSFTNLFGESGVFEQRLAVRTVGQGRADIDIYLTGADYEYYFAFSNYSNTVEFNQHTPYKQLWVANFKPEANMATPGQEHYLPLYFRIEQDRLTFSMGCMQATRSIAFDIKTAKSIKLAITTTASPGKLLFDCPAAIF